MADLDSAAEESGLISVSLGQAFAPRKRIDGYLVEIRDTGGMILLAKKHLDLVRLYMPKPWMMHIYVQGPERPTLAHVQIVEVTPNDTGSLLCKMNFSPVQSQRVVVREAIRLVREQAERHQAASTR